MRTTAAPRHDHDAARLGRLKKCVAARVTTPGPLSAQTHRLVHCVTAYHYGTTTTPPPAGALRSPAQHPSPAGSGSPNPRPQGARRHRNARFASAGQPAVGPRNRDWDLASFPTHAADNIPQSPPPAGLCSTRPAWASAGQRTPSSTSPPAVAAPAARVWRRRGTCDAQPSLGL